MAEYLIKETTLIGIADAIRGKTGGSDPILVADMAEQIDGITGGGGSAEGVHYVTFMSQDGTTELYRRVVADGDDCAEPVSRGLISAPTKESTAQYDYSFVGWATTPNGAWDENALKAVTENKTVYAAYASVLRHYTITFYDDDGTTVLKTESLAYGAIPNYAPEKDGCTFENWTPALAAVTCDASYTAVWMDAILFASSSWANIAKVCESGKAATTFALGDERIIPVTVNGTTYDYKAKIVGFDHDDLADGTGKAGISVLFFTTPPETEWALNGNVSVPYANSKIYSFANSFITNLPSELQSVIKGVTKEVGATGSTTVTNLDMSLWVASMIELGVRAEEFTGGTPLGTEYAFFAGTAKSYGDPNDSQRKVYTQDGAVISSNVTLWTRTPSKTVTSRAALRGIGYSNISGDVTNKRSLVIGFCI
jgi:hypothetical protein